MVAVVGVVSVCGEGDGVWCHGAAGCEVDVWEEVARGGCDEGREM